MVELPVNAFNLISNNGNDKIQITIDEIFGFPETTCYADGYEFKGTLIIQAGCYKVHNQNYYSTTGELYRLYASLIKCYDTLTGTAKYCQMYEKDFTFEIKMNHLGHVEIDGEYTEYPHLPNKLIFQIQTDQTCILNTIHDLKQIKNLFGDMEGKKPHA